MDFSRLLEKIARGNRLNEREIQELRFQTQALEEVKDTIKTWSSQTRAGSTPVLSDAPIWTASPLHSYSFQRQADLSVLDNTKTFITFDTFIQHGAKFRVDPADSTKILISNPGHTFQISGIVNWDNNATGYRYIALEGFKEDGTSLGFIGLHLFPGTVTEDNSFPISFVADPVQLAEMTYMKFFLRQTSGGPLTCFYILLTAFIV